MRKYGLRLSKRLGQHFLVDDRVLARIVEAIVRLRVSRVVELGPGAGALTRCLLEAGLSVEALEIDERMIGILNAELADERLKVHRADIAKEALAERVGTEPMLFVGNLPYQVTSPVLFGLLPALRESACRGAVFMMQAEVGDRLAASPPGKDYGILSVLIQARARVRKLFTVKPGSFLPPPRVRSAVMELLPRTDPVELGDSGTTLVKTLFGERRKQMGGLLRRHYGLEDDRLTAMAAELGLDPHRRAETLQLEEFMELDRWLRRAGSD